MSVSPNQIQPSPNNVANPVDIANTLPYADPAALDSQPSEGGEVPGQGELWNVVGGGPDAAFVEDAGVTPQEVEDRQRWEAAQEQLAREQAEQDEKAKQWQQEREAHRAGSTAASTDGEAVAAPEDAATIPELTTLRDKLARFASDEVDAESVLTKTKDQQVIELPEYDATGRRKNGKTVETTIAELKATAQKALGEAYPGLTYKQQLALSASERGLLVAEAKRVAQTKVAAMDEQVKVLRQQAAQQRSDAVEQRRIEQAEADAAAARQAAVDAQAARDAEALKRQEQTAQDMDKYRADRDAQAAEAAQREKEQAAEAAKQQEIAQEAALQEQDRQEEDALERQAQRWATEQLDAAEAQRVAQQEQIGADQARWGTGRPDDSGKIPTGGYRVTHTFSDGDRVSDNRVSPETGLTPTETDILAKLGLLDEYNYQVLAASHHAQHDRRLDPRVYDETRVVDGLNKILAGVVENPALVGPGDEREWRKYWADRMYSMGERLAGREPTVIPQLPVVPEAVVTPEPPESLEPTPGPASEPANGWDMSGELDFSASGGSAEPLTGTVLPAANQQPVPPARYWEPARDGKAGRYVDDDGDTMYPGALPVPGNSAPQPEAGNTTESKELTPAQRDEMSKLSAPGYNGSVLEEWRNIARRLDNISRSPQNEDTQRQTDYIDQRLGEILDVLLANPVFAALGEDRILDALVQERLKVEAARKESAW